MSGRRVSGSAVNRACACVCVCVCVCKCVCMLLMAVYSARTFISRFSVKGVLSIFCCETFLHPAVTNCLLIRPFLLILIHFSPYVFSSTSMKVIHYQFFNLLLESTDFLFRSKVSKWFNISLGDSLN